MPNHRHNDNIDLSEFEDETRSEDLRQINADLQRRLRRAKARTEDLVEAALRGAYDAQLALGPVPPVPRFVPSPSRNSDKPEVALWHLTDWQGSKVTVSYNTEVMYRRVLQFCDRAERITAMQRLDHPVDDCFVLFGGDLAEGLFQFPQQPFEVDATIFDQFVRVARLVAIVVRRALANHAHVTVVREWGNHGRIGQKRAAVPRHDNLDRMIYELARMELKHEEDAGRLEWRGGDEDIQRVEIGNYRALLIHGDEVGRNGYASPMTIVRHVAQWQSGAYPWRFRDCYMGHYHNHQEWSLPNGKGAVYMTGAPESDNRYARDTMAAAATPTQRLHFIDPVKGRVTAQYKVWIDE